MARASYNLNEYATSTIKSSNGTTYNGILGNGSVTRDISSPVQITSPSEYWDSMGNFRFGYGLLLANP